MSKHLETWP